MSLEELAKFVCPEMEEKTYKILKAFRSDNRPTIKYLMQATGDSESTVKYHLKKMEKCHLVESCTDTHGETRYRLTPDEFKRWVNSEVLEPLRSLFKNQ